MPDQLNEPLGTLQAQGLFDPWDQHAGERKPTGCCGKTIYFFWRVLCISIFLVPRFCWMFCCVVWNFSVLVILLPFLACTHETSKIHIYACSLLRLAMSITARLMLYGFGFWWISEKFLGDKKDHKPVPQIVVCNHISHFDNLPAIWTYRPSFIAKESIFSIPLIGQIMKYSGCISLSRERRDSRADAIRKIQDRIDNHDLPPLLVYPEGTTTNGTTIVRFRLGAFRGSHPVKPLVVRTKFRYFNPNWCGDTSGPMHLFETITQLYNTMEVIHLPVYYPTEEEANDPRMYASNVQRAMADAMGLPRTSIDYYEEYLNIKSGDDEAPPEIREEN